MKVIDPRQRVSLACLAAGCEVRHEHVDGPGRYDLSYTVDCPTHLHKVQLLAELAEIDSYDPEVRRRALDVCRDYPGDRLAQLLALFRYVQDGITFVDEPIETFAEARLTLQWQLGDCDCMALALAALLRAAGFTVRLATLRWPPTHVAVQVLWDGSWAWLEATIPGAAAGEHPVAARRRLTDDRPDIP